MQKKKQPKPMTNKAGDIREWTKEDFARAVPFSELPKDLQAALKAIQKRGRPKAAAPKEMIAFRFSPDVLAAIKGLGKGYNVRIEKLLREALLDGRL
ncbi:MAG: hypothetical protein EBR02_01720 [Alphaproteobacteria bacterium]|nr:hypothetical protein [Alphaproteobacteria bacterium]